MHGFVWTYKKKKKNLLGMISESMQIKIKTGLCFLKAQAGFYHLMYLMSVFNIDQVSSRYQG